MVLLRRGNRVSVLDKRVTEKLGPINIWRLSRRRAIRFALLQEKTGYSSTLVTGFCWLIMHSNQCLWDDMMLNPNAMALREWEALEPVVWLTR